MPGEKWTPKRLANNMLKDQILFTLKFFDLQNTPLTLTQLRDFLLNDPEALRNSLNDNYEILSDPGLPAVASAEDIQAVINGELADEVESMKGLYCLRGRTGLIEQYFDTLIYRKKRDALIHRYVPWLKYIPFVRGVAIGGSHTLGKAKKDSDIDLLMILDPEFLWLGRILVTGYFQLTGHRRHHQKVANRFCLNHYLAGPIAVDRERDPYNAMEYLRLHSHVYPQIVEQFVRNNLPWIQKFFPQAILPSVGVQAPSRLQKILEYIFRNPLGRALNMSLGRWQMKRIMRGEPAVAGQLELSFHSMSRKFEFLGNVFSKEEGLKNE